MNQRYVLTYLFFFFSLCPTTIFHFRFQRREYAKIDIVKTEKKGYGLRAGEDLPRYVLLFFCVAGGALKLVQGRVYIRIRRGCRFESFVYQADAGVC